MQIGKSHMIDYNSRDVNQLRDAVVTALRSAGVGSSLRSLSQEGWDETCLRLNYFPVAYSSSMIDYQLEYFKGQGCATVDVSLLLRSNDQPCGIWPLSIRLEKNGDCCIGSNGSAILPPLFVSSAPLKTMKSITSACFETIDTICRNFGQVKFESLDSFVDSISLSEWHHQLMSKGATVTVSHDLFVDLTPSIEEIKSRFRRRYKSLISVGDRLWNVEIVGQADPSQWDEFHQLHLAVAGRVTRSKESWRLQHEAIALGNAFLVRLRDEHGRFIGGALFYVTRDEGLYAVGVYDRDLFDKPIGHVVQYYAIKEMKRRGLRWYKLGSRVYCACEPEPSSKEMNISNFKHGFASHIFPSFHLRRSGLCQLI